MEEQKKTTDQPFEKAGRPVCGGCSGGDGGRVQ